MVLFCCCSFHPKLSTWFLSLFVGVVVVVVIHDSPHDISEEIQRSILCPRNTPVNMPDPIRKRFCYGQLLAVTASVQPESGRIVHAGSDFPHPFFRRRHGSYCAKLTRIRSEWSGQGLAKRIWSGSKPVCRNHRARFLTGRNKPATSFPLSDSVPFFHRRPG